MKARWTICLALLLALTAFPAAGQETILGFLEGVSGAQDAGFGATPFTGWAVADSGVQRVEVLVDGAVIGQVRYGGPRPAVAALYPGFPDSSGPSFVYQLNTTDLTNGIHDIQARVVTNAGNTHFLEVIGTGTTIFELFVSNNTAILAPFGEINKPLRNSTLYGTCNRDCFGPLPSPNLLSPVSGWVLDLGVEIGDTGVGWAELLVGGSILYNTRTDCTFQPGLGLHQCFGLPRLDIEQRYPFAQDAPNAGYRFLLDVGDLITCRGFPRGLWNLTIRSGDISTQTANIDELPVFLQCVEDLAPGSGTVGNIEVPVEGFLYSGTVTFQGWALAIAGIERVEVYLRDGPAPGLLGLATFGVDSRPGVAQQYPGYPDVNAPVWRFNFDTTTVADGVQEVLIFAVDSQGASTLIGERNFVIDNTDFN